MIFQTLGLRFNDLVFAAECRHQRIGLGLIGALLLASPASAHAHGSAVAAALIVLLVRRAS